MSKVFTLDDGTREYIIQNTHGDEICKLHFRPSDLSLAGRWKTVRDKIAGIIEPLEKLDSINADGTASMDDSIDALTEAETRLKSALCELLDAKEIADIFRTRSPFSSVKGRFFCENVIDMISGIIDEVLAEETEASAKRTSKYIEEDSNDAGQSAANT